MQIAKSERVLYSHLLFLFLSCGLLIYLKRLFIFDLASFLSSSHILCRPQASCYGLFLCSHTRNWAENWRQFGKANKAVGFSTYLLLGPADCLPVSSIANDATSGANVIICSWSRLLSDLNWYPLGPFSDSSTNQSSFHCLELILFSVFAFISVFFVDLTYFILF